MRYVTKYATIFIVMSGSFALCAADTLPYVAKRSTATVKTDSTGRIIHQVQVSADEMRDSKGSKFYRVENAREYDLFSAEEPAYYKVREDKRVVERVFAPPRGSSRPSTLAERLARKTSAKGTKMIAGVQCHVFPAKANVAGLTIEICHDLQNDILLEQTQAWTAADGTRTTVTDKVTHLNLDVEPDSSLFTIPLGFTVEERQRDASGSGSLCAACPRPSLGK